VIDEDLIRRAKIAWHDNKQDYIALPIYSTDGTHLLDLACYKQGHEWVGCISHEDMVELVRVAEVLRKEKNGGS
jgi:hypothetical protein